MRSRIAVATATVVLSLGCSDKPTSPVIGGDQITLSQAQFLAMSARADQIADANPSLRSFVDSTLLALQAGVTMKRIDVETNLTDKPLYFVGIHRVINQSNGSAWATWTVVGFEDPSAFANVIQTSGFTPSGTTSVSGTIGDGTGIVHGQLIQVAANGSVSTFNYAHGTASFVSSAPSGPCPNGNPEPRTACTLETMTVRFEVNATQSISSSFMRTATVTTDVQIPAMRLTYTP